MGADHSLRDSRRMHRQEDENSSWIKAIHELGLVDGEDAMPIGDEDDYGDDAYDEPEEVAPARRGPTRRPASETTPTVRTMPRSASGPREHEVATRPAPARSEAPSGIRTMPATSSRVHVVEPRSFNDAQAVGERLKSNQPVVLNLQGVDRDLQRRLIDFASGATFGLSGSMTRVADQVFLIEPADVEISAEERTRLQSRGLMR